jgi:hypothetical protein
MVKFVKKDDGLVTIEWVGIAAVMVLAAIAITAFIMQGAEGAAGTVSTGVRSVNASDPPGPGTFGNGVNDPVHLSFAAAHAVGSRHELVLAARRARMRNALGFLSRKFLAKNDGTTTIEWVAIAAIVLLAAMGITSVVLQGADGLGGAVADQMDDAADNVP